MRPESVLRRGLLIHPTVMMGRTEWFRANPYDAAYVRAEDRELWVRTCATTKFGRLCEPLFFYREGLGGNLNNYVRTEATDARDSARLRDVDARYMAHARPRDAIVAENAGVSRGDQARVARRLFAAAIARWTPLDATSGRAIIADIMRTRVPGLGTEVREEALACPPPAIPAPRSRNF